MTQFDYVRATSWAQAANAVAKGPEGTLAKGAGIDLWDRFAEGLDEPPRVVSLLGIPDSSSIEATSEGGLRIGALATLDQIGHHPTVREQYAALADAAKKAANPNVRHAATVGGNLAQRVHCHYFRSPLHPCVRKGGGTCYAQRGDNRMHALFDNYVCAAVLPSSLAVALAALDARVDVVGPGGVTKLVAIESLFVPCSEDPTRELWLDRGELIRSLELPPFDGLSAYAKAAHRESQDWPIVEVAVALRLDAGSIQSARVVLGAVSMTPVRARATEDSLVGQTPSAAEFERAASLSTRGSTPLQHNRYKVLVVRTMVRRALLAAVGEASP